MDDDIVRYDKIVKNSLGDIIQFICGEENTDVVQIEPQNLDYIKMKKKEFENVYKYELDQENWNASYMLPKHMVDLRTIWEQQNDFVAKKKLESNR